MKWRESALKEKYATTSKEHEGIWDWILLRFSFAALKNFRAKSRLLRLSDWKRLFPNPSNSNRKQSSSWIPRYLLVLYNIITHVVFFPFPLEQLFLLNSFAESKYESEIMWQFSSDFHLLAAILFEEAERYSVDSLYRGHFKLSALAFLYNEVLNEHFNGQFLGLARKHFQISRTLKL